MEVSDLTNLVDLTEDAVMDILRARYERQTIYTYTGNILVALNPFCSLPIYTNASIKQYANQRLADHPPHIFAIAELAYSSMKSFRQNQTCIISGESGAGKSESTKYILQYLAAITSQQSQESWVEQQILEANTVLEAFGNAKTSRNDNSSRFGKFIQVNFSSNCTIRGASIISYLLEKSRVVRQGPGERNYHIFYQLACGVSPTEAQEYKLSDVTSYEYTKNCTNIDGVDDGKLFSKLKLAMTVLNLPTTDVEELCLVLSGILWIGNIKFGEDSGQDAAKIETPDILIAVAQLWGVQVQTLSEIILFKRLTIRGETTLKPLTKSQAAENRDSIAKSIYDSIFQRMILFINSSLASKDYTPNFIGVLDIFGFEVFEKNSFEQLCINYTNEKLQQYFNQFIFKLEQDEYENEGIKWDKIKFTDNSLCLELIEGKPQGVLSLLDEETKFPKGTDDSWLQKTEKAQEKHVHFFKPRLSKGVFGVRHYAGEVTYSVEGLLEKNRDSVAEELFEMMKTSSIKFFAQLAAERATLANEKTSGKSSSNLPTKQTAASSFRTQLTQLVASLSATKSHYIRCIKPNPQKRAFEFEDKYVLAQLRYSGLLDTIRIRKAGYSTRVIYSQFVRSYNVLIPPGLTMKDEPRLVTLSMMKSINLKETEWQMGKTKIFMKADCIQTIQYKSNDILASKVLVLQKHMKGFVARKRYLTMRKSVLIMQKYCKGYIYYKRYMKARKAVIKIQAITRGWFARDYCQSIRSTGNAPLKIKSKPQKTSTKPASDALKLPSLQTKSNKDPMQLDTMFSFIGDYNPEYDVPGAAEILDFAESIFQEIDNLLSPELVKPRVKYTKPGAPIIETVLIEQTAEEANLNKQAVSDSTNDEALVSPPKTRQLKQNPLAQKGKKEEFVDNKINYNSPDLSIQHFAANHFETFNAAGFSDNFVFSKNLISHSVTRLSKEDERSQMLAVEGFKFLGRIQDVLSKKVEDWIHATQTLIRLAIEFSDVRDEFYVQMIQQITPPKVLPKHWEQVLERGWLCLALSLGCFPPSKQFKKYLHAFLLKSQETYKDGKNQAIVKLVEKSILNFKVTIINGARKLPPSRMECFNLKNDEPIMFEVFMPDESLHTFSLNTMVTAGEVVQQLERKLGLSEFSGWSLFELKGSTEHVIRSGEYILDLLAMKENADKVLNIASPNQASKFRKWEKLKRQSNQSSATPNTIQGNKILFKKRIFHNPLAVLTNVLEAEQLYYQAISDIVNGKYAITGKTASQLAALCACTAFGKIEISVATSKIEQFYLKWIPAKLASGYPKESWVTGILNEYEKVQDNAPQNSMSTYLDVIKSLFPYYGAGFYSVTYCGYWRFAENLTMAITHCGIDLLHNKTKQAFMSYIYRDIYNIEVHDHMHFTLTVIEGSGEKKSPDGSEPPQISSEAKQDLSTGARNHQNDQEPIYESYKFQSEHADEIVSLVREYYPMVGKKKTIEATNESLDFKAIVKSLEKVRVSLLDAQALYIPGPATQILQKQKTLEQKSVSGRRTLGKGKSVSNLDNYDSDIKPSQSFHQMSKQFASNESLAKHEINIRRLSGSMKKSSEEISIKASTDIVQALSQSSMTGSTGKIWREDYCIEDWEFSKIPLSRALISDASIELDEWASKFSLFILLYTGLSQTTLSKDALQNEIICSIQLSAAFCVEQPSFINEVYLQLIRQTSLHSNNDNIHVLKVWGLLCIFTNIFAPTGLVREYLILHLRKYTIVIDHAAANNVGFTQFRRMSQYCYQSIHKTIAAAIRATPPSYDEIVCTMNCSPMQIRIWFDDGQFRAIPMSPHADCKELKTMLFERIKLDDSCGFAIFETFKTLDRCITDNEKLCDVLYKWETYCKKNSVENELKFYCRKRLFLNPLEESTNTIAEDFIWLQIIDQVRMEHFPLFENEAIELAALLAQSQYGDSGKQSIRYYEMTTQNLPQSYHKAYIAQEIEERHSKLVGLKPHDAHKLYMQTARKAWRLFGSSVFEVRQSYTHLIPGECWLAVNADGIHILAKNAKEPVVSYTYRQIISFSPSPKSILLIVENPTSGSSTPVSFGEKHVLSTDKAPNIAQLMRDYLTYVKPN